MAVVHTLHTDSEEVVVIHNHSLEVAAVRIHMVAEVAGVAADLAWVPVRIRRVVDLEQVVGHTRIAATGEDSRSRRELTLGVVRSRSLACRLEHLDVAVAAEVAVRLLCLPTGRSSIGLCPFCSR